MPDLPLAFALGRCPRMAMRAQQTDNRREILALRNNLYDAPFLHDGGLAFRAAGAEGFAEQGAGYDAGAQDGAGAGVEHAGAQLGAAGGGIYAEPGEGSTADTTYNKAEMKTIPVLFLCRNESQQKCLEQLESICNYFQKLKKHPNGESFSWLNTEIVKYPSKIGRDEDGTYHYSCILRCLLYF